MEEIKVKNKYAERYKKAKETGLVYDSQMEYQERADVGNGSWVLITRTIPIAEYAKPKVFGIYWGIPNEDTFGRQTCIIHTKEDVTLLNHEFVTIDEEKLKEYRQQGWEMHEIGCVERKINTEMLEAGRSLCEEEREIIWALQVDGLTEDQACEEYFLTKHTDYNNATICYIPHEDVYKQIHEYYGER